MIALLDLPSYPNCICWYSGKIWSLMLILFSNGRDQIELSSQPYTDIISKQRSEEQHDGRLHWILGQECRKRDPVPEEITTVSYLHSVKIRAITGMCTAEGSNSRKWVMRAEKHGSLGHQLYLNQWWKKDIYYRAGQYINIIAYWCDMLS